jgi:hypothetical protein
METESSVGPFYTQIVVFAYLVDWILKRNDLAIV